MDANQLDALLYRNAQGWFGDAEDDHEDAVPPDDAPVDLGYPLALAWDLWLAWKDGHVMPRRGGYLDQPRRWQRMIHAMNRRFNYWYERAKAEHRPLNPRERLEDYDPLEDRFGASPFGDGQSPSWEAFRGTPS